MIKNIVIPLLLIIYSHLCGQNILSSSDWQADLDFLEEKLEERHANLFHSYERTKFRRNIEKLKELASTISEKELLIRMSELMARVGDAHTFLDFRNQKNWQYELLPFEVDYFDDGLFVVGSDDDYAHLIGAKILEINSISIDTIMARVKDVDYNENSFTKLISVTRFIMYPEVLKRFGFLGQERTVNVVFRDKEESVAIDFDPTLKDSIEWVYAHDDKTLGLPMSHYQKDRIFELKYEKENDLVYVQLNKCREDETHRFKSLADSIVKITLDQEPKKLVLDLRNNKGGNSQLTYPLLYGLMHFDNAVPDGQIFVIIGRWTLSASIVLCDEINKFCSPLFIGEPTGAAPNLYGENSYWLTLPISKLEVSYSSEWFQPAGPFVNECWIAPDIYLPKISSQYFNLEEPILDSIRSFERDVISYSEVIYGLAMKDSIDKAVQVYESYKSNPRNKYKKTMTTIRRMANLLGRSDKLEYSLKFHELNTRDYKHSAHAMLNLAESYTETLGAGKAELYYLKARDLLRTDGSINEYLRHYFEDYIEEVLDK